MSRFLRCKVSCSCVRADSQSSFMTIQIKTNLLRHHCCLRKKIPLWALLFKQATVRETFKESALYIRLCIWHLQQWSVSGNLWQASFHRLHFPLWNDSLKQWGSAGRIISEGAPYWTTAAKHGQRGEISSLTRHGHLILGTLKKHTTKQEHLRDERTRSHARTQTHVHTDRAPEGLESRRYRRSPPVALEPGTACHLELGGGYVRGVLKPSGTCLDRVADHLAWHPVYQ